MSEKDEYRQETWEPISWEDRHGWKDKDNNTVKDIQFNIENLLSPENLMDNEQVKKLQNMLNQYVVGDSLLSVDGVLGGHTEEAIKQFHSDKRYWGGHSVIDINPLRTKEAYDENMKLRRE